MALLRGSVGTGPDQNDHEGGPASSRGQIGRADLYVGARQGTYGHREVPGGAVMNRHSAPKVG